MQPLKSILPILLLLALSGCVGYWKSGNSPIKTQEISKESFPYFGNKNLEGDHPFNGTKIYDEKVEWCGLTIWAVIPIPLQFPVCRSFVELTFVEGHPIKSSTQHLQRSGAFCGPLVPLLNMWRDSFSPCATQEPL